MVHVQFSDAFDHVDELASMPRRFAPLFLLGIDSLGRKSRVVVWVKCTAPATGEIKNRHVEEEPRIVSGCALSKYFAHMVFKIVLTLFCFHVIRRC